MSKQSVSLVGTKGKEGLYGQKNVWAEKSNAEK
jgi:hypothetical protein